MDRTIARVGSWAGLISVIGIVGYHATLQLVAGQRVSGTTDAAAIAAYYSNNTIALLGVEQIFILVPAAVFFVALRDVLGTDRWTKFLGTIALAAGVIELALIAVVMSAQAAIVVEAQAGHDLVGSFRFFDVLYNTGVDVFEATWIGAFGLAMRGKPGFARWMVGLSLLASGLLYLKATAIWIGIPDPVTLPVAVLTVVWFVGASLGLRRLGVAAQPLPKPSPA